MHGSPRSAGDPQHRHSDKAGLPRPDPDSDGIRVTQGNVAEPGRAGINQDVPLLVSGVISALSDVAVFGIPHRFATTLYKGTVAGVRESALMELPD